MIAINLQHLPSRTSKSTTGSESNLSRWRLHRNSHRNDHPQYVQYAQQVSLTPTVTRSSMTSLTLGTKESKVLTCKNSKILGVIPTFNHHAKNIRTEMQTKNNVLKTISGSTWGKLSSGQSQIMHPSLQLKFVLPNGSSYSQITWTTFQYLEPFKS